MGDANKKMKAAIYTPYLDTLGGGERYMLSVAKVLLDEGWQVDIENKDPKLIEKADSRFSLSLDRLNSVESIARGDGYDLCVWLSDGSVPNLRARKNILHFQRPFYNVDGSSLMNRMKFFRIHKVVVNSQFTKKWIDKEYSISSKVLYPPVDIKKFKSKRKQKMICYVGRFSTLEQVKGHDVLIKAFKKFAKTNKDFKLYLIGGSEVGKGNYVAKLRRISGKANVEIIENAPFSQVVEEVGKSLFFWSAAGYGVEKSRPEKKEHFGITLVESMAAGCIPLVYDGGGHKEIIENPLLLWKTPEELVTTTDKIASDKKIVNTLTKEAKKSAQKYSYEKFKENFLQII